MTTKMKRVQRCRLYEEGEHFRSPLVKYLKELATLSVVYDTENYFYDEAESRVAIEGNFIVLCGLIATANKLFITEGLSFDVALLEYPECKNKNRSKSRLWFYFKPDSRDNRMEVHARKLHSGYELRSL